MISNHQIKDYLVVFSALALFLFFSTACQADNHNQAPRDLTELRSSYGNINIAPMVIKNSDGDISSGVLYDISVAIAKRLNVEVQFIATPRKRMEQVLLEGIADLNCGLNPKWVKSNDIMWSQPLYNNPDLLINNRNLTSLTQLESFKENKPLSVGTVLGYYYPELTTFFDRKKIERIDSLTPSISFERFNRRQFDAIVVAQLESTSLQLPKNTAQIKITDNLIHCALSPSLSNNHIIQINQVIDDLIKQNVIKGILTKYTAP